MAFAQLHMNSFFRPGAAGLCQAENQCNQPLPYRSERQLFNDSHQPPQARAYNCDDFEPDIRMFAAKILKILARNEQHFRIFQRRGRRGIIASVKYGKLSKRTARTLNRQDLLTSGRREFEDANLPSSD